MENTKTQPHEAIVMKSSSGDEENPPKVVTNSDIPERFLRSVINASNLSLYMRIAELPNIANVNSVVNPDSNSANFSHSCAANMGKKLNEWVRNNSV